MAGDKKLIDWEAIEREFQSLLANCRLHGKETDIVRFFMHSYLGDCQETRIPMSRNDTVVREMAFKFGRADIVVFHIDGSASVIEVKDGTKGYNHVVSGIGQAGLYAAQLAINKQTLKSVRKCLLWTSTGNVSLDAIIEDVCENSGVIALPWAELSLHLAQEKAVSNVLLRV